MCCRGMDKFRVCLSAGPNMRATFSVEYQQLLIMRLGIVKHTVSIQPTQPVPHLQATVSLFFLNSVTHSLFAGCSEIHLLSLNSRTNARQ